MQQQKSWLVYWFVLLMFTLSSCGGGGSGGSGGTNSPANDPTNPQHDKITISLDSSNGGVANGETNVSLIPTLALAFSKPMQPETINPNTVILSSSLNTKDGEAVAITSLTPNADNTVFTFSPAESLQQNTKYYVSVTQDAKSADGAELDFSTQLSFSTGTIVVPTVSMLNPANNAHDVSRTPTIQLNFSESVNGVTTAHVILHANSESGAAVAISNITSNDNIAYSFTPVKALDQLTTYYVVVGNGITDNAGNQLKSTTFSFTTASTVAPTVSMLNPANNAHDVSRTPTIQLKFSESVNGVTADNVSLHENSESGTPVKIGKITSEKDNTYSFSPLDKLKPLTAYYVVVSSKITDELGTNLNPTKFNFTVRDIQQYAYVTNFIDDSVSKCNVNSDGNLSACASTGSGFKRPNGITTNEGYAYVVEASANTIIKCDIQESDASLTNCASTGNNFSTPDYIAFNGAYAYVNSSAKYLTKCDVDQTDGHLFNCADMAAMGTARDNITFNGKYAYILDWINNAVKICSVDSNNGNLTDCHYTDGIFPSPYGIAINDGYAYVTTLQNGVFKCTVDESNGNLTNCTTTIPSSSSLLTDIAFNRGYAYFTDYDDDKVLKYNVESDGSLTNRVAIGNEFPSPNGIAFTPI